MEPAKRYVQERASATGDRVGAGQGSRGIYLDCVCRDNVQGKLRELNRIGQLVQCVLGLQFDLRGRSTTGGVRQRKRKGAMRREHWSPRRLRQHKAGAVTRDRLSA